MKIGKNPTTGSEDIVQPRKCDVNAYVNGIRTKINMSPPPPPPTPPPPLGGGHNKLKWRKVEDLIATGKQSKRNPHVGPR